MLFLTRCPACNTTFRMTREQLLVRDGKVRCGACRHVFNAMEHLLEETAPEALRPAPAAPAAPAAKKVAKAEPPQAGIPSKAGNSGDGPEDFSTLFGTLGLPNLRI